MFMEDMDLDWGPALLTVVYGTPLLSFMKKLYFGDFRSIISPFSPIFPGSDKH